MLSLLCFKIRSKGSTVFWRLELHALRGRKALFKIWLNRGLKLAIFLGTGPTSSRFSDPLFSPSRSSSARMEIKTAEDSLTARALRARSRAVELSKERKNVCGQATQGAEFFVIFLAIHHCCVYLCDLVLCEIVKEISRIILMVIMHLLLTDNNDLVSA